MLKRHTIGWVSMVFCLIIMQPGTASAEHVPMPWPQSFVSQLPPSIRQVVRDHARSDPEILEFVAKELPTRNDPVEFLSVVAIGEVLSSQAGVVALVDLLESTSDRAARVMVAERFAMFGSRFGFKDPLVQSGVEPGTGQASSLAAPISRAFEKALVRAADPAEAAWLSRYFVQFQERRILATLIPAMEAAVEAGDEVGSDLLRLRYRQLFSPGALPDFFYRRFATVVANVADAEPVRILAFGDFGTGKPAQISTAAAMRSEHNRRPFHFGVTVGDNFYPVGLDDPEHPRWKIEWEELYGPMGIRFYPTLGNHDYESSGSALAQILYSEQSDSWEMPAPNYSVRAGPVELFALDTNVLLEDQLTWLSESLKHSTAAWRIVYGHHPIYSSGTVNDREPIDVVRRLLPILKEHGVQVYLNGHDHAMEEWAPEGGVHFFTIGAGGASIYERDEALDSVFRSEAHGFGILEITRHRLTIQFVDINGDVIHERVLIKHQE